MGVSIVLSGSMPCVVEGAVPELGALTGVVYYRNWNKGKVDKNGR